MKFVKPSQIFESLMRAGVFLVGIVWGYVAYLMAELAHLKGTTMVPAIIIALLSAAVFTTGLVTKIEKTKPTKPAKPVKSARPRSSCRNCKHTATTRAHQNRHQ